MTPERFQQIEKVFRDALDCEPEKRSLFLDQACAGEAELRREVESMLAANQSADNKRWQSSIFPLI